VDSLEYGMQPGRRPASGAATALSSGGSDRDSSGSLGGS
jgi:hypothetical protein